MDSANISQVNVTLLQEQWNLPWDIRLRRIIIGSVILSIGFIINVLALYGTVRLNKRWTPDRCLMVNFCICHLSYCLTSGESIVRYATKPYFGYISCQIKALLVYASLACTVFSMLMVSFHRYFRIIFFNRPELGFSTVKKTVVMIAASWAFNFALLSLPLTKLWGEFGLEATNQGCRILKSSGRFVEAFLVLTYTIIPIVLQAGFYLHIYIKVRRQNRVIAPDVQPAGTGHEAGQGTSTEPATSTITQNKFAGISSHGIANTTNVTNTLKPTAIKTDDRTSASNAPAATSDQETDGVMVTNNSASDNDSMPRHGAPMNTDASTAAGRRRKREIRLALLAFGFVATYVICFIPYSVTNTLNMLHHPVHEFTLSLVWAFLAINPMLYILVEERVRSILKQRLTCK